MEGRERNMRYALVTGAAGGLGIELVKQNLAEGFYVFALETDISDELRCMEAENKMLRVYRCDISSGASVNRTVKKIENVAGRLDRVFNNAGIHRFKAGVRLEKTELDFVKTMVDINAAGALRVVQAAWNLLGKGTVLVYISSEAASIGGCTAEAAYAYHMSKAAMNMGARIADNTLRKRGVRTLCVHPGRMKTVKMGSADSEIEASEAAEGIMKLLRQPDALPEEAVFLDYKGTRYCW